VSVVAAQGAVALGVAGSFADSVWSGALESLDVRTGMIGDWSLAASTPIEASPSHAKLSGFRMESNGTTVSAQGSWAKHDTLHAMLQVDSLAYAFADTLLPEGLNAHGYLDLYLDAHVSPAGDVHGRIALDSSPGHIAWQEGDDMRRLEFDSTYVHGAIDSAGASASLNMRVHSGGEVLTYVSGGFEIPEIGNIREMPEDPEFTARVKALFADLSFVNALSRDLDGVTGRFVIDAGFEGVVSDPHFAGVMELSEAKLNILPLGLKVRDVAVKAEAEKGEGVALTGSIRSGGGTLKLEIEVSVAGGHVHLTGEDFEIINTAEAWIRVSPDLEMKIEGNRIDLNGKVFVPFTRIEVFQVPQSAVGVSKDVVFIGADTTEAKQAFDVYADLRVTLPEDSVTFRGFGLFAELDGSMSVRERPGKPTTAAGELIIRNGTYDAYGQLLKIDPGRISYAGGPIDNPGLDITAYREITQYNVRAGLRVQGPARQPQVSVFSDPAMSQNEALSYLLTGQPLSDSNQRDMAMSAALSMGMAQGNAYMQSVGRDVGLDEARFESGGTMEEASFVAGKYLSPQLYISNTMGLFDRVSTWRVRYFINRHWTLQAESGRATGSDLFYQYERGE
jgi:translocation and assembly module TamB